MAVANEQLEGTRHVTFVTTVIINILSHHILHCSQVNSYKNSRNMSPVLSDISNVHKLGTKGISSSHKLKS
jgi:hypothetical protein